MTIKYNSIEQLKNLIHKVKEATAYVGYDEVNECAIKDYNIPLPTIKFDIDVKLHGTNAGIRFNECGELVAQSRERDLSLLSDNAGFYQYVMKHEKVFTDILNALHDMYNPQHDFNTDIVVFGEWCGGTIQKGVALNQLERMLVVFDIKLQTRDADGKIIHSEYFNIDDTNKHLFDNKEIGLYNITQFNEFLPQKTIEIDFSKPEIAQNKLIEITNSVEAECPVGKFFGVSGIGEGIVIKHKHKKFGRLSCKVKGNKHSNSKVKTLAPIDEEKFNKVSKFVDVYLTDARMKQAIFVMQSELQLTVENKNIGVFIKWLCNDIIKEEQQSIVDNDLCPKTVANRISTKSRNWFLNQNFEKDLETNYYYVA